MIEKLEPYVSQEDIQLDFLSRCVALLVHTVGGLHDSYVVRFGIVLSHI